MKPMSASRLHHAIAQDSRPYLEQVLTDVSIVEGRLKVLTFIEEGLRTPARVKYRRAEDVIWVIWHRLSRRYYGERSLHE